MKRNTKIVKLLKYSSRRNNKYSESYLYEKKSKDFSDEKTFWNFSCHVGVLFLIKKKLFEIFHVSNQCSYVSRESIAVIYFCMYLFSWFSISALTEVGSLNCYRAPAPQIQVSNTTKHFASPNSTVCEISEEIGITYARRLCTWPSQLAVTARIISWQEACGQWSRAARTVVARCRTVNVSHFEPLKMQCSLLW